MQGLTYLKKLERKKAKYDKHIIYILIFIIFILYSLALSQWRFGDGLREGMSRVDATVSKALQGGYDVGVEKGLEALEVPKK